MAVRAVLDVNVLVPGILGVGLGRSSPPVTALVAALEGGYQLIASPQLLDELHAVLQRSQFGLGADLAHRWAELIGSAAEVVRTLGRPRALKRDPADNKVLECALQGDAGFLVTGNLRHFDEPKSGERAEIVYHRVRLVTAREFVESKLDR